MHPGKGCSQDQMSRALLLEKMNEMIIDAMGRHLAHLEGLDGLNGSPAKKPFYSRCQEKRHENRNRHSRRRSDAPDDPKAAD